MFKFILALALGKTLGQVEDMTSSEFTGWIAFDRIRPLPDPNFLASMQCVASFNACGNKSTIDDWAPWSEPARPERLSPQESVDKLASAMKLASLRKKP